MKAYAAKHKRDDILRCSQSGGMFTALSDKVFELEGMVYGCILNNDLKVVHIGTSDADGRNKMRGSKYVQSDLGNTFFDVKKNLEEGRFVMFTGTPCQVAGLKKYLIKEYINLLCVDLVCFGVSSPKVFEDYVFWQKKRNDSDVINYNFRNKELFGWNSFVETIYYKNGNVENTGIFRDLFSSNLIIRPSCFSCQFKNLDRQGDITIADCWGIEKINSKIFDERGVSLVLINSKKGESFFELIKNDIDFEDIDISSVMQPCLQEPFKKPENRDLFWEKYDKKSFTHIAKKYTEFGKKPKKMHFINLLKHIGRLCSLRNRQHE